MKLTQINASNQYDAGDLVVTIDADSPDHAARDRVVGEIVRRCNCHDVLVDNLRDLLVVTEGLREQDQQLSDVWDAGRLKSFVVGHPVSQRRSGFSDPKISSVVQTTERLFSGSPIEIEMEVDPSEPEQPFVVFKVSCGGELQEILEKEIEWNRMVREAESGYSGQLRLLVCPTE